MWSFASTLLYVVVFAPLALVFIYAAVRLGTIAHHRSIKDTRKPPARVWQEHNKE